MPQSARWKRFPYFGELRMLSRALILATVMLLIGCFAAAPADAQATNLEAGKSPSQIFAGTCTACHKSPRGLLKSVPAGSLPSFLRQHYTTSPEMAGVLSSFLISNGATDTRYGGGQGKPDKDAKSDSKPGGPPQQLDRQGRPIHVSREPVKPEAEPQQAAKPDADGISPREEGGRKGRNARRLARPAEEGAKPAEGEAAAREAGERGPDGRKLSAKQRLGKRGKPVEEMPKGDDKGDKGDAAKPDSGREEPASAAATKEDKPGEAVKDESVKPSDEGKPATGKSDTAKVEPPQETAPQEIAPKEPAGQTPSLRADPVPEVTPAPASAAPSEPATASSTPSAKPPEPSAPAAAHSAASEPAAAPVPPPVPATPAGKPEPPISR
jgi:hypothetical protein